MTLPATARRAGPFNGNGVTTAFPFTFKIFAASDIKVIKSASQVQSTLVLNSDYSVSLNADQDATPGGTITYPISGSALASGETLSALGALPFDQPLDLPSGGNFSPIALENTLDRIEMQIQQVNEVAGRALTLPISSSDGVSTELPVPVASGVIGWNSTASGLENIDPSILATIVAYSTAKTDIFSGDGSTTTFTLSENPATINNLNVTISGIRQRPNLDFTWTSGTNVVFTSSPPAGVSNILISYAQALPIISYTDYSANISNEYYPYVISGLGGLTPTNGFTGLSITIQAGSAWVEGKSVTFPGQVITVAGSGYTDVYLNAAGAIFQNFATSYTALTENNDKAKLFRVEASATKILGISDFRAFTPATKVYQQEAGLNFDKLVGDFDIPKTALTYTANTFFNYAAKVKIGTKVYQCVQSGTTGAASAPSGYAGTTWDATLNVYVFVDGTCEWVFIADEEYQGAFRWGLNNGIVWYFSNIGLYYVADRVSATRLQEYIECYILNLVTRWTSGAVIVKGMKRYINGNVYKCTTAGTTGVTAPSGTGSSITDGTVTWAYFYPHVGEYVAWASSQVIVAGARRTSSGNIYQALTSGTTGVTAPTGTAASISDGSVTWSFLNPVGVFTTGADWYIHDTQTDRYTVRPADSHDSYASTFLRLVMQWLKIRNDYTWLASTNVHGLTNLATLKNIAFSNVARCQKSYTGWAVSTAYTAGVYRSANSNVYLCVQSGTSASIGTGPSGTDPGATITDGTAQWRYQYPLATGLITTFQNELSSNATDKWPVCYLQDNCENYSGIKAFADYLTLVSDSDAAYYTTVASGIATGATGLYQSSTKAWRYADNVLTVGTSFYPDMMAAVFPELHQVPVGASSDLIADKYNHGWEFVNRTYPSWWNRHPDTLASLILAFVAVRFRQEPLKGAKAVEFAMAHYLRQGLPQVGTFMFSDLCYAFAMRSMYTNALATQGELSLWQGKARGNLEFTADGTYDIGTASLRPRRALIREFMELEELTATPSQPATNRARLFTRDNGSNKTQLCILWPGNTVTVLSTEP